MNTRFLRDEAARFRGMADEVDREATKLRLLAMAVDYDARATAADGLSLPKPDEAPDVTTEPIADETILPKVSRKAATVLKKTVTIERRPAGHLS